MYPKIAIVYLSFHCEPYIEAVVDALEKLTYPKDRVAFVIVDNPHPEHGSSAPYLTGHVLPKSGVTLPETILIANETNLGFADGNNKGVEWALAHGFDYVYFHNNDAFMDPGCLEPLAAAMERDPSIAIAQSFIRLYPDVDRINSAGNALHFLGFGYCMQYKKRADEVVLPLVKDIPYASGAAMMVRTSFMRDHGAWDGDFFLYHEDTDFSLRARTRGYRVVLVRDSVMYHQYEFKRSVSKYFWMERNRWAILLLYYRWLTLLLIAPALIAVEIGTAPIALLKGWWRERLRSYAYWLRLKNWKLWFAKRKMIQATRTIGDRVVLTYTTGRILFQESDVDSALLRYIANPVLSLYLWVVKKLVIW